MKILQANMHRSRTANDLLHQIVLENQFDVIISEQYKKREEGFWLEDDTKTAAIWIPDPTTAPHRSDKKGRCQMTIFSCYLTSSDDIQTLQAKLEDIEDNARHIAGNLIIAGDLNSRDKEWGMPSTDSRGRRVLNMAARIGKLTANVGEIPIFNRVGNVGTIPDITLETENCTHKIADWKVLDTYNGSDHCYIVFNIAENEVTTVAPTRKGWNANRLDKERLIQEIDARLNRQRGGNIVSNNMTTIRQACNAAMPKMGNPRRQGQKCTGGPKG
ncbi:uncharacterized protein [Drosophila kikkawai]|uniref:Endonuclease/exonuclease/phosphatase domain-containing protein n=1 Tax=Drosophila kikkawai TaxID=30033 RepID=A0ABM4GFU5_DROKI